MRLITIVAALAAASFAGAQPKGWQVIKDKSGVCQMAVPPDWHLNPHAPGMATAPDVSDARVMAEPGKEVRAIPPRADTVLGVDRMIENTGRRVFWAGKPVGYPPMVVYHVTTAGKGGTCVARVTVKANSGDTVVKQIADTVGPVK